MSMNEKELKVFLGNLSTCLVYIANQFNYEIDPVSDHDLPWNPGKWAAGYFSELESILGTEEIEKLVEEYS